MEKILSGKLSNLYLKDYPDWLFSHGDLMKQYIEYHKKEEDSIKKTSGKHLTINGGLY